MHGDLPRLFWHMIGMQNVVQYTRYSTPAQEKGDSHERQLTDCNRHAETKGWGVAERIADLGRSAWKGDHLRGGALGRFADRVRAGDYPAGTILLVEKCDRLSRQGFPTLYAWLREMIGHGVRIAVVSFDVVLDPVTIEDMVTVMRVLMAGDADRRYSDNISDRVGKAWDRKQRDAAEGKIVTRRVPGWVELPRKGEEYHARNFRLIPERVDVLIRIFEWTADGLGGQGVAAKLNEAGVEPWGHYFKGAKAGWEASYIKQLIWNPTVEGDYQPRTRNADGVMVPRGDPIPYYPRAVPAELVARARAARASRRQTGGGARTKFAVLLSGRLKCASCGHTMHNGETKVGGVSRRSVRCTNVMRKMGCTNRGLLRYERFEEAVLDKVLALALDDQFFTRPADTIGLANRVAELEKLIADRKTTKTRLFRLAATMDEPDADLMAEINDVARVIRQTEERLTEAKAEHAKARGQVTPDEHMRRVLEVRGAINDSDPETRQAARMKVSEALKAVVDVILCDNHDPERGEPEKTYSVALVGGLIGFKIAAATGEIIRQWNITGRLETNPTWARAVNHRSNGPGVLADVMRRQG